MNMTKEFLKELSVAMSELYEETYRLIDEMKVYAPEQFDTNFIVDIYIKPDADKVTVCLLDEEKEEEIREYEIPFEYYENDDWKLEFEAVNEAFKEFKDKLDTLSPEDVDKVNKKFQSLIDGEDDYEENGETDSL